MVANLLWKPQDLVMLSHDQLALRLCSAEFIIELIFENRTAMVEHANNVEGGGVMRGCAFGECEKQVDTALEDWAPCFPCMKKDIEQYEDEQVPVKHVECIGEDMGEPERERGYISYIMTGRWACKDCCWFGADAPDVSGEQAGQRQAMRDYLRAKQAQ